jgi:hypothetical protein
MYRVKNLIGWSSFSDVTYILAASVPSKPPAPILVTSTSTSISLGFSPSADNGGDLITSYQLYMDDGTGYAQVLTYIDNSMAHTLTTLLNGLIAGNKYYFKYESKNSKGNSV